MLNRRTLAALTLVASACGTSPQTTELRNAVATGGSRAALQGVAFRFAGRRGADVRLYELPGLDEVSWQFDSPDLVASRLVGFAADDDVVYAVTPDSQLTALELESGRPSAADSLVARATLGPDGTVFLVRSDGTLGAVHRRRATTVGKVAAEELEGVYGTAGGRLLAISRSDTGRTLIVGAPGALAPARAIPDGRFSVAPWGDAVAIATDTGLVVVAPHRDGPPRFLRLRPRTVALSFSSSGHRIYLASDDSTLQVIDRFDLERLGRVALPAMVTELRADPFGRWLIGRTEGGLLVVPQRTGGDPRVVEGGWAEDLPAAAPDGTLLVRRAGDVVALDPGTLEVRGRVADAARDRWLIVPWDPRRPALQVTTPSDGGRPAPAGHQIYVQVSSTSNQQWADKLARDLVIAGLRASVLAPAGMDEMFRVVIGPYGSRDEAEETGRKLGMPYWIFTRDADGATPP